MKEKKRGAYGETWNFIKESRNYLLTALFLFLASAAIGFIFPVFFLDFIKKFIEELAAKTAGMNFFQLFLFIFSNNMQTAFLGLFLGAGLGIFPLIINLFNGYILGFVANSVVASSGAFVLWRLLPHGIFEIPALILSFGLGLRLGMFMFGKKGERKKDFIYNLVNSFKTFLYVILPLLLIAALIEAGLIAILG